MLYTTISKSFLKGSIIATSIFGLFVLGALTMAAPAQKSENTLAMVTNELQAQNPELAASVFAAVSNRNTTPTKTPAAAAVVQTTTQVEQPVAPVNPVPARIKQWYTTAPGPSGCHLWQLNTETNVLTDLGVGTVLNLNGQNYCYVGMVAPGSGTVGTVTGTGPSAIKGPVKAFSSDVTLNTTNRVEVSMLQSALLTGKFFIGEVTGKWNTSLGTAVKAFQKANKLRQTGFVDANTRALLNAKVTPAQGIAAF